MGKQGSNNAPKVRWWPMELACGTKRQRLYIDGVETPYFIDSARYHAHRSYGHKHGLWGSGMGKQTSAGWCCAGFFGGADTLSVLKQRAEQMALTA